MAKYLIGFEIVGHVVVNASNPQAAAAEANGKVRDAAKALELWGENEYRSPYGPVVDLTTLKS